MGAKGTGGGALISSIGVHQSECQEGRDEVKKGGLRCLGLYIIWVKVLKVLKVLRDIY